MWWFVSLLLISFTPSAHYLVFQSVQIANPLAIRSFNQRLPFRGWNKGDGGDHSGLRSLHGTASGPLQNSQQRLTGAWGKRAFDKGPTVLGVRGWSGRQTNSSGGEVSRSRTRCWLVHHTNQGRKAERSIFFFYDDSDKVQWIETLLWGWYFLFFFFQMVSWPWGSAVGRAAEWERARWNCCVSEC